MSNTGRKPLLIASALGTLVLAWPLFWLMHHPSFALMLAGQMGFAVLLGVFLWVGPAAMVEVFPARVRCSAYSVGYNLTQGFLAFCSRFLKNDSTTSAQR